MSRIELLARQDSLYHWIMEPANHSNPNWKKVIAYWLRLTALICDIKLNPNTTPMETKKEHAPIIEELATPPKVMEIEVIDFQIVEP